MLGSSPPNCCHVIACFSAQCSPRVRIRGKAVANTDVYFFWVRVCFAWVFLLLFECVWVYVDASVCVSVYIINIGAFSRHSRAFCKKVHANICIYLQYMLMCV